MRAETLAGAASVRRACAAALVVLCLAAGQAAAQSAITGINVATQPDRVVITVQANCALKMTPLVSSAGSYLGFQFPCRLTAKGGLVGVHSGRIHNVRYSNFSSNPPATRIVVNSSGHLDYSTDWSPDKRRVVISVMKFPASAKAASKPAPASAPAPVAKPTTPAAAALPAIRPDESAARPVVRVLGMAEVKTGDAQEPQTVVEPEAVAAAPQPRVIARVASTKPIVPAERKVSLNFLGADINDVLKALSVQSGRNIVASKDVTGNVTVSLSNVGVEEALSYIAKLSGYTYTRDNDTYLVAQGDKIGALTGSGPTGDKPALEFVWLQYASAEDVKNLLAARIPQLQVSLFGQKGQDSKAKKEVVAKTSLFSEYTWMREVPPSSDMLALSGTPEMIAEAKSLIAQAEESIGRQKEAARKWIDDKRRECYTVKYANPEQLSETIMALVPSVAIAFAPSNDFNLVGFESAQASADGGPPTVKRLFNDSGKSETSGGSGQRGGAGGSQDGSSGEKLTAPTSARTLVMVGDEAAVAKALELAAKLDVKAPQVKIEAKITSLNESGEKKLGLSWDWTKSNAKTPISVNTELAQGFDGPGSVLATLGLNKGSSQILSTLQAIITAGDGQLLASPSMVCLDRNPGVFFVGDEVTYIQRIEVTPTGQNITTDTKRVGVQLLVVPETNSDGYITLYLHPEVSTLKLTVEEGVTLPIVSSRFTDHVVRVKSGETIVIGGLIRNDEIEEMSKMPLLGDLPILGKLFRHTAKTNDHTEVAMLITASEIKE